MQEVVGRSRVLSQDGISPRLPIASLTCDLAPPVVGKPSFMTFDEVSLYIVTQMPKNNKDHVGYSELPKSLKQKDIIGE